MSQFNAQMTSRAQWDRPLICSLTFLTIVVATASLGIVPTAIAYWAGAPKSFVVETLQISMWAVIPFGLGLAYAASCYVSFRATLTQVCFFLIVPLAVIPLEFHPQTTGPLAEYIGLILVISFFVALTVATRMRRVFQDSTCSGSAT